MSNNFNVVRVNNVLQGGVLSPLFDRREDREQFGHDAQRQLTIARVRRSAPKAAWQTMAVKTLFTLIGTGAKDVPYLVLDGTNGVELIGAKRSSDGVGYATGGVHVRRRGLAGILVLTGLSWSKGQPLMASVDVFWTAAAGTTDPVSAPDLISLPTLAVNTEMLGLTTLLNGSGNFLNTVDSFELSIDHKIENNAEPTCFHADQPYPVLTVGPGNNGPAVITARFTTEDLETAIDTDGTIQAVWTLQANQGIGYGSGTAAIALRGLMRETTIPGADGGSARRVVECTGIFDGTTLPLTISVS